MASPSQISLIKALALRKHLDPRAVLAVAAQEGLGGGVGDSGTSFGPFQLHRGGALPAGVQNPASWAWSLAGLNYALSRIASVAGGLHGPSAVSNIVHRFERPADPQSEIAGALASYGSLRDINPLSGVAPSAGIPGGAPPIGSAAEPTPLHDNSLLQAVLSGGSLLPVIRARYQGGGMPLGGVVSPPNAPPGGHLGLGNPAELLQEGTGGPTHSTGPHIHVAYTNPKQMLKAIHLAERLGLRVAENPYTGGVDPVHAKNSYHYRTFPGLYGGKRLGEAIDVTGKNSQRFYKILSEASGHTKAKR